MNNLIGKAAILLLAIVVVVASVLGGLFYTVHMNEQAVITQFGRIVGNPVTEAGLHMKLPFIQTVNRIDKRVLEWDGAPTLITTGDKLSITVDTFARWQIVDPKQFFLRLRDERAALSRLDDVLDGETRNVVAKHDLIEMIRTTPNRKVALDPAVAAATIGQTSVSTLYTIKRGRHALEQDILAAAKPTLQQLGIELLDIRVKRVNYDPTVARKIFERMSTERRQIAERFRSEGAGEAAKIDGERERDLAQISSDAFRLERETMGRGDAEAAAIYARAYNQTAEAASFYGFQQTMETYKTSLNRGTTILLSTDSGLLRPLRGDFTPLPKASAAPTAKPSPAPLIEAPAPPQ